MTILVKIFNCKKLLIIFAKNSTLGIWQRSEYDSELLNLLRLYKFRYLPLNHKKVLRHCLLSLLLLLMMIMMLMMMMMSYLLVHLTVKRVIALFPGTTIVWNFTLHKMKIHKYEQIRGSMHCVKSVQIRSFF